MAESSKPAPAQKHYPYTIIIPTAYGQMLASRYDLNQTQALLRTGEAFDRDQIVFAIRACRAMGPDIEVLDIGANIGVYTLAISQAIAPFGGVVHASLEDSLAQMDTDPRAYDRLVRAWMAGDLRSLDREALTPLRKASPNIYRRMLLDRNTAWVAALDQRLKGHGKTVVVVGVGHLIGEAGAPARLRALGYSVEGP